MQPNSEIVVIQKCQSINIPPVGFFERTENGTKSNFSQETVP